MVELRIGKKTFEMKLVSWDFGSALLPLKEDEPAAETSPALQKIIGVRPGDMDEKHADVIADSGGLMN